MVVKIIVVIEGEIIAEEAIIIKMQIERRITSKVKRNQYEIKSKSIA